MSADLDIDLLAAATDAVQRREAAANALALDAEVVARACHDMAVRFHLGGKLIVFGNGPASTDAGHIAVEFVHPVLVGKRALPAMALTNDPASVTGIAGREGFAETFALQLRCFADPHDIALGVSTDGGANVARAFEVARELGLLTVALVGGQDRFPVDHLVRVRSDDPLAVKEVHMTAYHVLWELVHVFFEEAG